MGQFQKEIASFFSDFFTPIENLSQRINLM